MCAEPCDLKLQQAANCLCQLAQAGIRTILTLTNFWPEFGGIGWYVDNTIGAGQPQELFYTDAAAIAAYQTWVRLGQSWLSAHIEQLDKAGTLLLFD